MVGKREGQFASRVTCGNGWELEDGALVATGPASEAGVKGTN